MDTGPGVGLNVLVVDDDADIREAIRMLLEQTVELPVVTACSGEDALDILDRGETALVISDFRMGGMNGCQLLRRLRERDNPVPFVMMTAFGKQVVEALECDPQEMAAILAKPVDPAQVVDLVHDLTQPAGAAAA